MERFHDTHVFREERFSLGVDQETGRYFLSTPVSGRMLAAEFEACFSITESDYHQFLIDPLSASAFTEDCRMGRNAHLRLG